MLKNSNHEYGYVEHYQEWPGKFANQQFDYFARHERGRPIPYVFNSRGWRGPEHHTLPDISVIGSSFSFGVGIEFSQCWHQLLGNYKVNCYAPAGFIVTNNNTIDHYNQLDIKSGLTILQLREFKYNTGPIILPETAKCFSIDTTTHSGLPGFTYNSFLDKAADDIHPGPKTHAQWAKVIKKMFGL